MPETQSWQGIESEVLSGEMMEERTEKKKNPWEAGDFGFHTSVGLESSLLSSGLVFPPLEITHTQVFHTSGNVSTFSKCPL